MMAWLFGFLGILGAYLVYRFDNEEYYVGKEGYVWPQSSIVALGYCLAVFSVFGFIASLIY